MIDKILIDNLKVKGYSSEPLTINSIKTELLHMQYTAYNIIILEDKLSSLHKFTCDVVPI